MSPSVSVFIMMNNYFHDVATALLFASGVIMWIVAGKYTGSADRDFFLKIYRNVYGFAKFSFCWIAVGGIIRAVTYKDFEWANAVEKSQTTALIIKHLIAAALVVCGIYVWIRLKRKVKKIMGGSEVKTG